MSELDEMLSQVEPESESDVPLPSLEEQKAIAAKLKELEEKGELTPEVLAQYFAQFEEKKKAH
ncbi:restriction endonuclease subunit S [Motilimonas pumila]|uniref:Restriction endonuclease subunit S n=1 Tax=Motilimonas pumila TaxID=2303987 RepID=A0A418YKI5_9GAMM|nr:restriction endonuclease subunit S [Motilimonas pumila]RJG51494.1 restriction endonuclease subunit S [Motilimonas pumila]